MAYELNLDTVTNAAGAANAPANSPTVTTNGNGTLAFPMHTSPNAAALLATAAQKTVVVSWRNPVRHAVVNVPADAWNELTAVPEQYRGLLDGVLHNAAKTIIKRYVDSFTVQPASIPVDLLTVDAIMAEAAGNNTEWMSKDDLTAAWQASATRNRMVTDPRYQQNKQYRIAVAAFAELVLKLSGKTANYQPHELDAILAKLDTTDIDSPMGAFIVRRIEMLKNKKPAETADLMSLL